MAYTKEQIEKIKSYNKQIRTIENFAEAVRKTVTQYLGYTGNKGFINMIREIFQNSADELMKDDSPCTEIHVAFSEPLQELAVRDNGRGIPVDLHPQKKIPTLEVVLTILHAGGKFDNNAYKVSGGLHGVGVSVVNALSKKLVAQVKRDGKIYEMVFERGKTVQKMKEIGTSKSNGTTITFWPDDMIFETTTYNFDHTS